MKQKTWKLFIIPFLFLLFYCPVRVHAETASGSALEITAKAAVLIEGSTGEIIYEKNKDKELIPASITKIMTLNLIFESLEQGKLSLKDEVNVSAYAAGMGGSQVFLEENEKQTVETMIKCISIASANDAAVAMAEKIAGSEQNFVKRMNDKAKELGMTHTNFKNCTGLDDDIQSGHYSSACDVALMSRELIMKHPKISEYSTVWMDSIIHKTKKGETSFGLTNTNKLVRFYDGITGLKTGSTKKAKYCLSATAKRNGLNLVAVIMGAPDHKVRFHEAQKLLDYGFANCSVYRDDTSLLKLDPLSVKRGFPDTIDIAPKNKFSHTFIHEFDSKNIERKIVLKEMTAPIKKGNTVGEIEYFYKKNKIGSVPLLAMQDSKKAGYSDYLFHTINNFFLKRK